MFILVNIGHGGKSPFYDSGAIGADGTHEHLFNRDEFAPLLIKELKSKGHRVETIIQEKRFSELPSRINDLKPDVILSLHFNAANGKATGSEVLYWKSSTRSKKLAEFLLGSIVRALKLPNRGIKPLGLLNRGNALVRLTNAPCVIIEPFMGDNPGDLATARAKVDFLARSIAEGLQEWLEAENS